MTYVSVQIVRFLDYGYPGFVECHLTDVSGRIWVITEKAPMVSDVYLDENSAYPVPGFISCQVLEYSQGVARIDTSEPRWVESVEGETIFQVPETSLTRDEPNPSGEEQPLSICKRDAGV